MARHRQRQFLGREPGTIITNADQAYPALLQIDIQPRGAGIEGILDQFLDHRGRTFDDLTRRDLVDQHRSEEHTSELKSLMRISYAAFCLTEKQRTKKTQ